ncbi:MAG: hypothetical protein KFB93_08930 [Simkaniaceae bacterium]|nr:MAG: hypothetical protein KFB93_08930 [Simkaniaceae bacterium]
MAQPNFINFCSEIARTYQSAETKIGLRGIQEAIPVGMAHLISAISFVAMGYFAHMNTNNTLLGAGFMAGLFVSYIDPTCGSLQSLNKGALLPIDQKGSFALQKVYLVAALLRRQYGLPTGFFMGQALFHMIKENLPSGER